MKIDGKDFVTVWLEKTSPLGSAPSYCVHLIEQRLLPHQFKIVQAHSHRDTAAAIADMIVRGAPAIGATGGYGFAQVAAEAPLGSGRDAYLEEGFERLRSTRPTAQDLFYALERVRDSIQGVKPEHQAEVAAKEAESLALESAARCRRIGEHGAALIKPNFSILTHCNAGWLACVDWGTALSPIYTAHRRGVPLKVFADETRPRLQGANLTAWELGHEGVDYEIIADNAAGHLMRSGEVNLVITGADRIAANGDIANKIGTYEKALLAREHGIPFYVAAPVSTFDLGCPCGPDIPIEERSGDELLYVSGKADNGEIVRVRIAPQGARARNPAFDYTPARLITGLITESGIIPPEQTAIREMVEGEASTMAKTER